ncbi:heme NO-binding domain-containing protein [Erythrobacter sp.]|uniref:heme NO-binding domain-containing protein n=1 Tax=Erythrobacter sp. TaxID=1042 RepID=UPI0025C507D6|nr:heme NO-binding domain-containing protein [Erythrobacter sp.]
MTLEMPRIGASGAARLLHGVSHVHAGTQELVVKGIVFSELVGFLDRAGGPAFAEKVLADADLPHGGAYSRIGQYPWQEAVRVVEVASRESGADFADLCQQFGAYLFDRFTVLYADIVGRYGDAEALLAHVGDHIHEEVKVLYPDAQPPKVTTYCEGNVLHVRYASHRPFAHIAHGLVSGAMRHFDDERKLEWVHATEDGSQAEFALAG